MVTCPDLGGEQSSPETGRRQRHDTGGTGLKGCDEVFVDEVVLVTGGGPGLDEAHTPRRLPNVPTHSVSKDAMRSLTCAWPIEFAQWVIRGNAVSPLAHTPIVSSLDYANSSAQQQFSADDVTPVVTYLLNRDEASVTGQIVRLDVQRLVVVDSPRVRLRSGPAGGWDTEASGATLGPEPLRAFGLPPRRPGEKTEIGA